MFWIDSEILIRDIGGQETFGSSDADDDAYFGVIEHEVHDEL